MKYVIDTSLTQTEVVDALRIGLRGVTGPASGFSVEPYAVHREIEATKPGYEVQVAPWSDDMWLVDLAPLFGGGPYAVSRDDMLLLAKLISRMFTPREPLIDELCSALRINAAKGALAELQASTACLSAGRYEIEDLHLVQLHLDRIKDIFEEGIE